MSDIFLSYASEDREFTASLAKALGEHCRPVWWDQDLLPGDPYRDKIRKALDAAKCVVVIWSAASAGRSYVISEAKNGLKRNILVPAIIGGTEQPEEFREIQAVNLSGWCGDASDSRFTRLCEGIQSIIMPPHVEAYLIHLWNRTQYIEMQHLRISDTSANKFAIDELYTPLTTVLPQEERRGRIKEGDPTRLADSKVPLQRALEQPRLVLVGDPGAGKSTFLRRIVFEASHRLLGKDRERQVERMLGESCPFPILVRAGDLARHMAAHAGKPGAPTDAGSPEWLFHYLDGAYRELGGEHFRRRFREGCLFLLDGLDEIPGEAAREEIADVLRVAAGQSEYARARIVATSRPGVYGGVISIVGFASVKIAPLDDEAIAKFAEKWGRAVHPGDITAAGGLTHDLLREIHAKPEIRRMAGNPVMLTALACLKFSRTTLPEQRSELYDSVLEWLAKARQAKTGLDHYVLLGRMRKLAYAMHTGQKNTRSQLERYEAIGVLEEEFRQETDQASKRRAAERFLKEEEINSGIIVNDGDKLRFWHPTFQEYLAAAHLAYDTAERQKRLFQQKKVHDPEWRETVLLLAGCLKKQGDDPVDELLRKILTRRKQDGLRESVLAAGLTGVLLKDLAAWQYTLPPALNASYQDVLRRALSIFDKDTARSIPRAACPSMCAWRPRKLWAARATRGLPKIETTGCAWKAAPSGWVRRRWIRKAGTTIPTSGAMKVPCAR